VYDANGNMLKDYNKRIGKTGTSTSANGITYNFLNLPDNIIIYTATGTVKGSIRYQYTAAGQKLKKTVVENSIPVVVNGTTYTTHDTTFTHYFGGSVYQTKNYSNSTVRNALRYSYQLQFFGHEEGRVRALRPAPKDNLTGLVYDYMLKDHLGNVRMVLTEQKDTTVYHTLSFEGASGSAEANNQNNVWENATGQPINVTAVRTTAPGVLQNSGLQPPPLSNALLVRSSTGKVGAGKLIKVMAGDRIHTSVQYFYPTVGAQPQGDGLNSLLGSLSSLITNSAGAGGLLKTASSTLAQGVGLDPMVVSFFTNQNNNPIPGKPKAYLNVLFFDEQFKMDDNASKFRQVGTGSMNPNNPGQIGFMAGDAALAKKSGYCYIYITNESDDLVYFDNFTLAHERSSLIEETHYYPFGLTMAGISIKAAGKLENKFKFNDGTELNSDFDINLYETPFRGYDPQIGRFHQIDQLSDFYHDESPYVFAFNNPVNFNDPLGLEGSPPNFNNSLELLTYIQRNGIGAFGQGFTQYLFGDNGETTSVSYDPNPKVGKNTNGEQGIWVHYSYSLDNGYSEGFGSAVLGEFVVASRFIKADNFLREWEDYADYLDENVKLSDYWWSGLRKMRSGTSIASMTVYTKLPGVITKYTGKEGWWVGNNLKFNRAGWGGNGATGPRSAAKAIGSRIGLATKVFGAATSIISGVQAFNDFQHGNTKAGAIHTVDAAMGVVSLFGPVGAAISGAYFVSRIFWGNDD
jgi:RHS repeat-associated protein